mmetsp:Transcript_49346/g.96506  ORF Transcript_49346/g.96506 Transcript_49346/m.96506 type:complete len:252 (+) Transcript_49346:86-841(+)
MKRFQKSAYVTAVETRSKSVLSAGETTLASLVATYDRLFPVTSPSAVEAAFASSLVDPKNVSKISVWHDDASSSVTGHLIELIENVQTLEGWIGLNIPPMEDGNNFGVSVQLQVVKMLEELREVLSKRVDSAVDYYKSRAEATEKLLARSTQTTTSTENKVKSAGGKDGDENKSSESTTVERKSTVSGDIDEHLRLKGVVAIDMKYYAEWKAVLRSATDRYAAVLDQIEKNKEKITKPRGGNPGGAAMSMF